MRSFTYLAIALLVGAAACQETPVTPGPEPDPTSMTFKSGARYQYDSYHTDPSTDARTDSSARTRTWTLTGTNASANGKTGVAIFVDSVFSTGGLFNIADSVYLQQGTTNDIYRYASLVPELDVNIAGTTLFDIGKTWMHEAKLNATSALWFVGDAADTVIIPTGVPAVDKVRIAVTDSAVASVIEDMVIDGTTYKTTKTTHRLEFSISVLVEVPIIGGTQAVKLKSESLNRVTWIAPALGAIVKEQRDAKVIKIDQSLSGSTYKFDIPLPGYYSAMVKVLATGT